MAFSVFSRVGWWGRIMRRMSASVMGLGRFMVGFLSAVLVIAGVSQGTETVFGTSIPEGHRGFWILFAVISGITCGAVTHRYLDSKRVKRSSGEEAHIIAENYRRFVRVVVIVVVLTLFLKAFFDLFQSVMN